jgi:hypothetical protein
VKHPCKQPGCGKVVEHRKGRTGLCVKHAAHPRAKPKRYCSVCGILIGRRNASGLCVPHYRASPEHTAKLRKIVNSPLGSIPSELHAEYLHLRRIKKYSAAEAARIVQGIPDGDQTAGDQRPN